MIQDLYHFILKKVKLKLRIQVFIYSKISLFVWYLFLTLIMFWVLGSQHQAKSPLILSQDHIQFN